MGRLVRVRVLTRASDLARLQGLLVRRALESLDSTLDVEQAARESAGDRDGTTPLWQMGDKGAFTADLSDALACGNADIVVHSWKDLPIEPRRDTIVAATLPRADARDVLLIRTDSASRRAPRLKILSSSPRRALMLGETLPALLPWPVDTVEFVSVRGNVPTRLRRLVAGDGDALVVAKAALDRLLAPDSPFDAAARDIRAALALCRWMVLPLQEHPCAPAQGALALEAASQNRRVVDLLGRLNHARTWQAVTAEREILAGYGGGCAQAIGAAVLSLAFGTIVSVRGRTDDGVVLERWTLESQAPPLPRTTRESIWPRPEERTRVERRGLAVADPADGRGLYVTRAEALPASWTVGPDRLVWAAGPSTWRKLAARGVWVHASSEGIGMFEPSSLDHLAGGTIAWHRLTHAGADVTDALGTYETESALPPDLGARTHFFWRSASEYRKAIAAFPQIRDGWHACGPGHTLEVVSRISGARLVRPSLGYDAWLREVSA